MKASSGAFRRGVPIVIGVAMAWVASFKLNEWLFEATSVSVRANWIFMPAALRLIVVLLFDQLGALGLVLGAYLTMPEKSVADLLPHSLIAMSSGLAPLFAVRAGRRLLGIADSLRGLRTVDIIALSVGCAAANAIILHLSLWFGDGYDGNLRHVLSVFVGDVTGSALVLVVLSIALSFILPRRTPDSSSSHEDADGA